MNRLHLVCNAHLDPVWLWEWEEGAAEAVSTFRTAADLCEEFPGFVFNHNEVILYKWVEEYEPALFDRIRKLVRRGQWHIMGGWFLQSDCNMPSGESFVRQAMLGRNWFREKFGVEPTTAINFDPFGHTRGLVQILRKCGYDSYLICRPVRSDFESPVDRFTWVGLDGSEIPVHRFGGWYCSPLGKAREKVATWLKENTDTKVGLVLWGVGNHGGGPSRMDLRQLKDLLHRTSDRQILHSTPEAYFRETRSEALPRVEKDLNPSMVGCYTSQIRVKQKHRQLENEIYALEKMVSNASVQGLMIYPAGEIRSALDDLMFAQFHDILPGSSQQRVEEAAIRLMDHGLEIVSRLKARTFFALASGQPKAQPDRTPILAYNPHPFAVRGVFECEFQLKDQNWKDEYTLPLVYRNGKKIPCQAEKEAGNVNLDWRKRTVFEAELAPMQMNRFDVRLKIVPKRPDPKLKSRNGKFVFKTKDLDVVVNARTGLVDRYMVKSGSYLKPGSFQPVVIADNEDPWGMNVTGFPKQIGSFKLMNKTEAARFAGIRGPALEPVKVIEDGEVRTVIEALFRYGDSFICQRYYLPKRGTQVEVEVRVHWNEKNKMLKLAVPTTLGSGRYVGQTAFGVQALREDGNETVAQKWVAVVSEKDHRALTVSNDGVYGSDFRQGQMRISLLRSPAYAGHPIFDRPIVPQNRYTPRIDQGERLYRFRVNAGPAADRLARIDREALVHNEKPFVLSFFPSGMGKRPAAGFFLDDPTVQLSAFKKAEQSGDYIIRLYESTGQPRATTLRWPELRVRQKITLGRFEVKTFRFNSKRKTFREVNLVEQ